MALLNESFSLDALPTGNTGSYDALPAGFYNATIAGVELKNTKAGDGQYLNIRMDIAGPSHAGRVLFSIINIVNPNPKAEEIGRMDLGSLMRAIGLEKLRDTDELIGGRLKIKVDIEDSERYGPQNRVRGYRADDSAPSVGATKSTSKAPWQK